MIYQKTYVDQRISALPFIELRSTGKLDDYYQALSIEHCILSLGHLLAADPGSLIVAIKVKVLAPTQIYKLFDPHQNTKIKYFSAKTDLMKTIDLICDYAHL